MYFLFVFVVVVVVTKNMSADLVKDVFPLESPGSNNLSDRLRFSGERTDPNKNIFFKKRRGQLYDTLSKSLKLPPEIRSLTAHGQNAENYHNSF